MKNRIILSVMALALVAGTSFYAFAFTTVSYTIVVSGPSGGIDCLPIMDLQYFGEGEGGNSDHFQAQLDPNQPTFQFPLNLHNISVNGVMLDEAGGFHSSWQSVACYCCDCQWYCAYVTIDEASEEIQIQVINDPNTLCTSPGGCSDPQ